MKIKQPTIVSVLLREMHLDIRAPYWGVEGDMEVEFTLKYNTNLSEDNQKKIAFFTTIEFVFKDQTEVVIEAELTYAIFLDNQSKASLRTLEEELTCFSFKEAWPYFKHDINTAISRAEYPPYTLQPFSKDLLTTEIG